MGGERGNAESRRGMGLASGFWILDSRMRESGKAGCGMRKVGGRWVFDILDMDRIVSGRYSHAGTCWDVSR